MASMTHNKIAQKQTITLIANIINVNKGFKLPSNRHVLQMLFYNIRFVSTLVARKVQVVKIFIGCTFRKIAHMRYYFEYTGFFCKDDLFEHKLTKYFLVVHQFYFIAIQFYCKEFKM